MARSRFAIRAILFSVATDLGARRIGEGLLLAAIVGLAVWLRLLRAGESLWLDELHTAWVVSDGAGALSTRASLGNYSPVYFALIWVWTRWAGTSELALRLPSVAASIALLIGAYVLVSRWTSRTAAGLFAALLVALDHHVVFYGQEARPYALVQLLGLIHVGLFVSLLRHPGPARRVAWVVIGAGMVYLHYTSALLLPAEIAFYAIADARRRWWRRSAGDAASREASAYAWSHLATDAAFLLLCLVPALPQLREIAARRQNWRSFVPVRSPWRVWEMAAIFPLNVYMLLPVLLLAADRVGVRLTRRGGRDEGSEASDPGIFLLLACWALFPLALAWAATALGSASIFFPRYLMVAAAAPMLWAASCFAACRTALGRAALVAVVLAASVYNGGLIPMVLDSSGAAGDRNQDWRAAVRYLGESAGGQSPVFVRSGLMEAEQWYDSADPDEREYCLLPLLGPYRIDGPADRLFAMPVRPPAVVSVDGRRRVLSAGEAWCLVQGTGGSVARFEQDLMAEWRREGLAPEKVERRSFGNVSVLHVVVSRSPGQRG